MRALRVLMSALLVLAARAHAQIPAEAYLSADHWSHSAIERLAGLGLIDVRAAVRVWPVRKDEVRTLLDSASRAGENTAASRIARQYSDAFRREFPAPATGRTPRVSAWLEGRGDDRRGAMLGGTTVRGEDGLWHYPGPIPGAHGAAAELAVEGEATWRMLSAGIRATGHTHAIERAYLALHVGAIDFIAGRDRFDAGPNTDIPFSPAHTLDGARLRTTRAIPLPGFLRLLGTIDGSVFMTRFTKSGDVRHPWFSAMRVVLAPSRDLAVGLNRATLFGGEGGVDSSATDVLLMLFGFTGQLGKDSGFENQVASIDVSARTTAASVPIVLRGELGIDDVGFSMFETAAFTTALDVPSMPGAPALSLGIEHTHFPGSCCGHPPWYRHGTLGDGWTDRGRLLGHPLGGHGSELALNGRLSIPSRTHLDLRLFMRDRGEENLFAPDRQGSSVGGSISLAAPLARHVEIRAGSMAERGRTGWQERSASLALRLLLGASPE